MKEDNIEENIDDDKYISEINVFELKEPVRKIKIKNYKSLKDIIKQNYVFIIFAICLFLLVFYILFIKQSFIFNFIINQIIKSQNLTRLYNNTFNNTNIIQNYIQSHPNNISIMNITQNDNSQLQENNTDNINISQNNHYQSNIYEQKDNNNININNETTRNEHEHSQEKENNKINENEVKEKDINNKDEKKEHIFYTPNTFGDRKIELSFNYTEAIQELKKKNVNETIFNSLPKNKLSFAMCSIGKLENLYVRDFIIYYLELGVDKFYIYDNNEIDGEKFEDVIQDFL